MRALLLRVVHWLSNSHPKQGKDETNDIDAALNRSEAGNLSYGRSDLRPDDLAVPRNDFCRVWLNESLGPQDLACKQESIIHMAETRVGIRVADDRKTVAVEIGPVGGASSPVGLDLDQLTRLIHLLGQARRRMIENFPPQSLEGKTIETIIEPMWYIQVANIDGSLLAFDHPAFGPIGFALPRNDVAKIVRTLSEHLALPAGQSDKPS